jgi:XTP/dITP diphosphohydrolase
VIKGFASSCSGEQQSCESPAPRREIEKVMHRRLNESRLVLASHNPGKVREIAELLEPLRLEVVSAAELGLPEPEETGDSFEANAELKALAAATASSLPALADDSGLVVPALGGAPGIYSARWAGPAKDFAQAMRRIEDGLAGTRERQAHFVAVLSLAWPDGHVETFRGEAHGTLVWPPRGDRGFGYDPIFVPAGHALTYGEMDPVEKHRISHRAVAFAKLVSACLR